MTEFYPEKISAHAFGTVNVPDGFSKWNDCVGRVAGEHFRDACKKANDLSGDFAHTLGACAQRLTDIKSALARVQAELDAISRETGA